VPQNQASGGVQLVVEFDTGPLAGPMRATKILEVIGEPK
jgi:hypothetical protein